MPPPPSPKVRIAQRLVHYEKELKALMRSQLEKIEPGLTVVDGGKERSVRPLSDQVCTS